jgi:phospholipid transport system transporter-binding protein
MPSSTAMSPLKLPATLLHGQADACLSQWTQAVRGMTTQGPVPLDASALENFDSSALAVLLGLRRVLRAQGQSLQLLGMPPRLSELARLYGVLDLLQAPDGHAP